MGLIKLKNDLVQFLIKKLINKCGQNLKVYGIGNPIIRGRSNIELGNNVKLNEYCYLYGRSKAKITISDNTTISSYAKILTATYDLNKFLFEEKENIDIHDDKSVYIGENCWIGLNSIILPGVKLSGRGIIVSAGAVVTKSFNEDNIILAGVPAKIIKRFNEK